LTRSFSLCWQCLQYEGLPTVILIFTNIGRSPMLMASKMYPNLNLFENFPTFPSSKLLADAFFVGNILPSHTFLNWRRFCLENGSKTRYRRLSREDCSQTLSKHGPNVSCTPPFLLGYSIYVHTTETDGLAVVRFVEEVQWLVMPSVSIPARPHPDNRALLSFWMVPRA
jgi:hypothetical protein